MSTSSLEGLFDDEDESDTDESETDSEADDADSESEATEEAVEEEATEQSSKLPQRSPFRLAAFQPESEESSEDQESVEEDKPTDVDDDKDSDNDEPAAEDDDTEDSDDATEKEEVEYEPLENVSEQIRRILAKEKAAESMQQELRKLHLSLKTTYNKYGSKVVDAKTKELEIPEPPAALSDYEAIANKAGLILETTILLSGRELFGHISRQGCRSRNRSRAGCQQALR